MATFSAILSLWLLILAATQGNCGENQATLYYRDAAVVDAMRNVGQALECLGETTQDMMQQVTTELRKHNGNELSFLRDNEALNKVITLVQENTRMKLTLENKDHEVDKLNLEILDLKNQLENKTGNVSTCDHKTGSLTVQLKNKNEMIVELQAKLSAKNMECEAKDLKVLDLDNKLVEYKERVRQLENRVKQLNDTVKVGRQKPGTHTKGCDRLQGLHLIKPVVKAFSDSRDWDMLTTDLRALLNEDSAEYEQLDAGSVYWVGRYGYYELALLLLCAGLPADTMDTSDSNMLHAAARDGQLQVVKLLVDHGAGIDERSNFGWTPLMWAVWQGHMEVVQYLVQAGADTTIQDIYGFNALRNAQHYDRTGVAVYLGQFPH